MIKNVTKMNIKIEINIVKKFVIINDLMLNFRMLNFKKRTLIIMNMKIFIQMTNYTKR